MRERELRIQFDRGPKLTFGRAPIPSPEHPLNSECHVCIGELRIELDRAPRCCRRAGEPVSWRDKPVVRQGADRVAESCIRRRVRRIERHCALEVLARAPEAVSRKVVPVIAAA